MNDRISPSVLCEFLETVKNKLFKTLKLRENNTVTLDVYLDSFSSELNGNIKVFEQNNMSTNELVSVLCTIEYFINNIDVDTSIYKREMFKSIDLIKKLQNKLDAM